MSEVAGNLNAGALTEKIKVAICHGPYMRNTYCIPGEKTTQRMRHPYAVIATGREV